MQSRKKTIIPIIIAVVIVLAGAIVVGIVYNNTKQEDVSDMGISLSEMEDTSVLILVYDDKTKPSNISVNELSESEDGEEIETALDIYKMESNRIVAYLKKGCSYKIRDKQSDDKCFYLTDVEKPLYWIYDTEFVVEE